jgi:hypothetical protein
MLAFLKPMYKVLSAERCSGRDTQPAAAASVAANQNPPSKNLPSIPHQNNLLSSFSKSFISSGKQGGGATVLREGCDTVTRETCIPTVNNLGKAAVLLFAFSLLAGAVPNSAYRSLGTAVLMSSSHNPLPTLYYV